MAQCAFYRKPKDCENLTQRRLPQESDKQADNLLKLCKKKGIRKTSFLCDFARYSGLFLAPLLNSVVSFQKLFWEVLHSMIKETFIRLHLACPDFKHISSFTAFNGRESNLALQTSTNRHHWNEVPPESTQLDGLKELIDPLKDNKGKRSASSLNVCVFLSQK